MKPNLPVLGPRLGEELREVRRGAAAGEFEELDGGRVRVAGHELEPGRGARRARRAARAGRVAAEDGVTVALEMALDDELLLEGRGYDLIHQVNTLRRDEGLEITDRIVLTLRAARASSRRSSSGTATGSRARARDGAVRGRRRAADRERATVEEARSRRWPSAPTAIGPVGGATSPTRHG